MEFHSLSTIDLLSVMVGKARAAQLLRDSRGSIATLLSQRCSGARPLKRVFTLGKS
jgi:hypothetical protein